MLALRLSPLLACVAAAVRPRPSYGSPTTCVNATGGDSGPCGPGREYCGAPFDSTTPQYHVRSHSCGEGALAHATLLRAPLSLLLFYTQASRYWQLQD